jgi:hypothetical protein
MSVTTILLSVTACYGVSLLAEETVSTLMFGGFKMLYLEEAPKMTMAAISKTAFLSDEKEQLVAFLRNS